MRTCILAIDTVTTFVGRLAAIVIFPLILSMFWEVISRYMFSRPTIWAYEAAYMQMGALFVLGIAYVSKIDAHVRVDLLYAAYPPRLKAAVNLIGYLMIAPLVLWLCVGLWDYLEEAWRSGERSGESLWNPYVWPARLTFWLGFVLLSAQCISEILKCLLTLKTGRPSEELA